jgi:hypothetical protein
MAKNTKSRLGCLVVLGVLAAAAWLGRGTIAGWLAGFEIGLRSAPSERLAQQAEGKIERLFRLGLTEPVRFSEAELQSLLTYRALPDFPPGIEDPQVDVQDSVVVVSALVRPDDLESSGPDAVMSLLADTSRVISAVTPSIRRPGLLAVTVETLQVGSFVVPSLMIPMLVATLSEQGLSTSGAALVAPVPRDVARVEIDGDDVVLSPAEQP